jgi:hypothetical protein
MKANQECLVISESILRNLVKEKINNKYGIINEAGAGDPDSSSNSLDALKSAIGQSNKKKKKKKSSNEDDDSDDDSGGGSDDDSGGGSEGSKTERKKKAVMPKTIIDAMEKEIKAIETNTVLSNDDKISKKISVYNKYKKQYILPDPHPNNYKALLKDQSDPKPADSFVTRRNKSYNLAFREANKAVTELMPGYSLKLFTDNTTCEASIKELIVDVISDRNSAYGSFRNVEGRFGSIDAAIAAEIQVDSNNTKIGALPKGLSDKEKQSLLKNSLFDTIGFLLKEPGLITDLCNLEVSCHAKKIVSKNFLNHYIDSSNADQLHAFANGFKDSIDAGKPNYKRISYLIRTFFLPLLNKFKDVFNAGDKGKLPSSDDIVIDGVDGPVIPIWRKNIDACVKSIEYFATYMDLTTVDRSEIRRLMQEFVKLASIDTSDLILTRMSVMTACGGRTSYQDTFTGDEAEGSVERLKAAFDFSDGKFTIVDADALANNGVLLYKAVERQVGSADGRLDKDDGMLEMPELMGTYQMMAGGAGLAFAVGGGQSEDAHEGLAIMIAMLAQKSDMTRQQFINAITGKASVADYTTYIKIATKGVLDIFAFTDLPDGTQMKDALESVYADIKGDKVRESIKIKKVGQKYLIEEKQLKSLTKFLKKQKRRGNK